MPTRPFLLFDMGRVLLGFSHERMATQMAKVAAITYERAWQIVFQGDLNERFERGDLSPRQFYDEFCAAAGSQPSYDALFAAANDIFWLLPQSEALVGQLRSAGYRLGVLSNTNLAHWQYVTQRFPFLTTLFHVHATSFDLRSLKPDLSIYQAAAQLAGVNPSEIFFTDDRDENVAGAKAAGYDAVLFTSTSQIARELCRRGIVSNY